MGYNERALKLSDGDAKYKDAMRKLFEFGHQNFEENLMRCKKFKADYISNVMTDYE